MLNSFDMSKFGCKGGSITKLQQTLGKSPKILVSIVVVVFADYHFVSRDEMEKAIDNKEFIETAEYSKNLYGTR